MSDRVPADIAEIRRRLEGRQGSNYWKSLEELADTPEFREILEREFPAGASEWNDALDRRRFLALMGASLALAGVTACTKQPKETIAPFSQPPEELVPGKPLYYATALTLGGIATGVLVETHEGRPTKVEGNPDHPASLGACDPLMQAAILGLYDPDRSTTVTCLGEIRPWTELAQVLAQVLEVQAKSGGAGLRILTETVTSPTLAAQLDQVLARFPKARWHQYEPVNRDNSLAGAILAFGEPVDLKHNMREADVILSLDADFMSPGPGSLRHIREFASRRREGSTGGAMNRLYVVEPIPSNTGSMADHRLALTAGAIEPFARAVASALGLAAAATPTRELTTTHGAWVEAVASDLKRAGARGLVIAGDAQPAAVHALAHAMNDMLGAAGTTLIHTAPAVARPVNQGESIRDLCADMETGLVDLLVVIGGNPAFTTGPDLRFAEHLQRVGLRIHMSLYQDETSALCHWHVPQAHELEAWSDARAWDGTVTIQQPMIEPLYGGRTPHDLVAMLLDGAGRSSYDTVRDHWKKGSPADDFEHWWRKSLHDGMIRETVSTNRQVTLRSDWNRSVTEPVAVDGIELLFRPDPSVHDGRYANNGWLQELPRPITKLTWDNAALMSPALAAKLAVTNEAIVELTHKAAPGRVVRAPVWIVPGHADRSVTIHLGYGRSRSGRVGNGVGFNAYELRTSRTPWLAEGLEIRATGETLPLACTQQHHSMQGRHHVRAATLEEFREQPDFAHHLAHEPKSEETLYPPHKYEGHAWGMSIDLNTCVGCNACVTGCQSENNIPVVGKEQVGIGREMHWIRVDRYFEGAPEDPAIWNQPVTCMQCENAPCEPVCPVGATVHSSEGLNDMVYNRCVGTRYCSNNCPYKVRRFNFFLYADYKTPSLKLLNNPDVTVRSRGVMEKCTYCVQRINSARIEAHKQDREIRDGEITPACAQACPAQAIVFGDINDPESRVSKLKADPRNYGLLADLNTRPRTTYLAALRNPNPELESS